MIKATFNVLSESDKKLVLETEPKRLKPLDEDGLIDLHTRVRRARNKHAKLYRQGASAQVKTDRARALASKKNQQAAARAEVFEEALARVSRRLGTVAKASADALKAERLAQARAAKGGGGKARDGATAKPSGSGRGKGKKVSPATKKTRASTKSAGKRRQAKRDSR